MLLFPPMVFRRKSVKPPATAESTPSTRPAPLVTKVHLEAIKYAKAGYTIVLIGHEGHDEVIGTMGEAPEAILLVEDEEGVDNLQVEKDSKLAVPDSNHSQCR